MFVCFPVLVMKCLVIDVREQCLVTVLFFDLLRVATVKKLCLPRSPPLLTMTVAPAQAGPSSLSAAACLG